MSDIEALIRELRYVEVDGQNWIRVGARTEEVAATVLASDWLRARLAAAWLEGFDQRSEDWADPDGTNPYDQETA